MDPSCLFFPPSPGPVPLGCGRSDLSDTREGGGGRRGVSFKWRAPGCQRAPRALGERAAAVFGCDDTYSPRAFSNGSNVYADGASMRPCKNRRRANLNGHVPLRVNSPHGLFLDLTSNCTFLFLHFTPGYE
ncbi:hypothetical protein KM043_011472 [Ampulex compressa]|nr:hypothetical protein KM043_011472 [Ampulex compressa]